MTSARKRLSVTELPEIVRQIVENLKYDRKSLLSVIRVNKLWFECSIGSLWHKPPCGVFLMLPAHRLQFYASQVYDLNLSGAGTVQHEILKDIKFTGARKVCIDAYRVELGQRTYINQYLQAPLKELLVFGADLEPDFFEQLKSNCCRLNRFLLDSPGSKITADMLLDYLKASPALEHLEFEVGMNDLLTDDVLTHFGSRKRLKSIVLAQVTVEMMEKMCQGGSRPFDALLHFGSTGTSAATISMLAGHASQTLQKLELYINDGKAEIFHAVSLCPNLTLLRLEFPDELEAKAQDFMKLNVMEKLESLFIDSSSIGSLVMHDFKDDEFDKLFSNFSQLVELEFCPQSGITFESVRSLSRHCPFLQSLVMPISINVLDLNKDPKPAFLPVLDTLNIGNLVIPTDRETNDELLTEMVESLHNLYPKLIDLDLDEPLTTDFTWKVGVRYDELYNPDDSYYKQYPNGQDEGSSDEEEEEEEVVAEEEEDTDSLDEDIQDVGAQHEEQIGAGAGTGASP